MVIYHASIVLPKHKAHSDNLSLKAMKPGRAIKQTAIKQTAIKQTAIVSIFILN
jgi:hypothetical protein